MEIEKFENKDWVKKSDLEIKKPVIIIIPKQVESQNKNSQNSK